MTGTETFFVLIFTICAPNVCLILFLILGIVDEILKNLGIKRVITYCNYIMKLREKVNMGEYGVGMLDGRQEVAEMILKILHEKPRR